MAKDPNQVAQNWVTGLQNAGTKITQGVQGVTSAPGAAAAAQSQVWLQNTQASVQKFARNVALVTLGQWQDATINKGIPRIAAGAGAAEAKFATFMQKLLPYVANAKASLPKRGTYDQNKARANAMMDAMHKFSK